MKLPFDLHKSMTSLMIFIVTFVLIQEKCFGGDLKGKIVFSTQYELGIIDLEGEPGWKTPLKIDLPHRGDRAFNPTWLPDGVNVIFEYSPWTDDINDIKKRFAIINTKNMKISYLKDCLLTKERNLSYPKWAPNGKLLAFLDHEKTCHIKNEKGAIVETKYLNKLLIFDKQTTTIKSLGEAYPSLSPLSWSMDSKKIVYASTTGEIIVFDLGNDSSLILCKGKQPVIDPATEQIYYIAPDNHLYRIGMDGKSNQQVDAADWSWSQLVGVCKDGKDLFFIDGGSFLTWEYKTIQVFNLASHKKRIISKKYGIIQGASLFR
jgi:Tol biopolymer transport system component